MPPIRLLVIDDDATDRRVISEHLNGVPGFQTAALPPPPSLDCEPMLAHPVDAVLVDYQLSAREANRPAASYRGSTLAAVLREKLPNHPIVLITRQQLISAGKVAPSRDLPGAFDALVVKSAIYEDPGEVAQDLARLVRGFRKLAAARKTWNGLRELLGASDQEDAALLVAEPPEALLRGEPWRVPEVARWIRLTLLEYPGVLYDSLHAASALGLAASSYQRPVVQRYFRKTRYDGPFAPLEPVVWKAGCLDLARKLLRAAHLEDAPLTGFADAWRRRHGGRLSPAVCVWCGESPADAVCHLLKAPVMRRHSVAYNPDTRPAIMDQARVSYRAIRQDDKYDERLVAPDARELARAVEGATDEGSVPA